MNKISLKAAHFKQLKGLKNADFHFSDTLTAIMGVNGAGKTTVIHALACVYQPDHIGPRSEDYKFPYFFIPNTDSLWSGSEFSIVNEIENERHIKTTLPPRTYHKDFDRWAPRYENRPKRNVYYLGIDSCLPDIEKSTPTSRIRYTPHESTDPKAQKTIEKAGGILNKRYTMLFDNEYRNNHFPGVSLDNGIRYSSLSMGTGEQRTIRILEKVYHAELYSLILIDELDLLLHVSAFRKLIKVLYDLALQKHLQIIFTTHSLDVISLSQYVQIQYIDNIITDTGEPKSLVYDRINEDLVYSISGTTSRPIKVYVEDTLAKAIVRAIVQRNQMSLKVEICTFGSISNAFTLAASFVLTSANTQNVLIVTDGDEYRSYEEKKQQIKTSITGTEEGIENRQKQATDLIKQFNLPEAIAPEKFLYDIILAKVPHDSEVYQTAIGLNAVTNSHNWINEIRWKLDMTEEAIIRDIFSAAHDYQPLNDYIKSIEEWLVQRKDV